MTGDEPREMVQDASLASLTLLAILRNESQPMDIESLGRASMFRDDVVAECLVELSRSGPVVAIDVGGECFYSLEWGVKHALERDEVLTHTRPA